MVKEHTKYSLWIVVGQLQLSINQKEIIISQETLRVNQRCYNHLVPSLFQVYKYLLNTDYICLICKIVDIVVQSLSNVWLCDPMDCSMPGFPVLHYLPEFTQTHVHRVGDAISSSPLLLLLPLIFPSIRISSSGSALHIQWPNESGVPDLKELAI